MTKRSLRIKGLGIASIVAASALVLSGCSETGSQSGSSSSEGSSSNGAAIEGLSNTQGQLVGEGASSQQKAMDYFNVKYQTAVPGASLAYNPTGSGSGQEQFINGQVVFAGSDSALKEEQVAKAKERCGGADVWHLPFVIGPVAIAYNVPGVDDVALTTDALAKIFKGEITKWNDPAIAEANEGAELPDKDIKVVYRSDESGTSDNFQKFLSAAAPGVWTSEGKAFPTEVGSGANGSSGVANEVEATEGAITYVESGFAKEKGLSVAKIDFGAGPVELNAETVGAAIDGLVFKSEGNDMVVDSAALFSQKEEGRYPLVLTTYEIVCSDYSNTDDTEGSGAMVKDFLTVALNSQDSELENQGFIPVAPESAHGKRLAEAVAAIK
ncbi:phosphate ABC transporter substrate-binding protein PstS [Corynebacterium sp. sy017]|uniref:phosphate ABC transporter substrate-binding protein PstS n=1 Tax=unclassified Corynebacterium TaxID=2624378 RepID=UPI0011847332|nr:MULTISPECIES: phosphate ABC transporter substrate-binding protein PstS [unclassified Corynebacterium]MBP3089208.1 phosphate ABC transporter substrate-binding protein PstS [Corynebacterium sp. sy017]TSD91124.1 phosphate ABC transporter substrate-binding protein PstS [Corynebacterium sp. SY003]